MFEQNEVVSFTYGDSQEVRRVEIKEIDYKNFQMLGKDSARDGQYRRFKLHEIHNAYVEVR